MALVFSDGFDSYSSKSALLNRYDSVGADWTWHPTAGRFGGGCIQAVGGASATFLRAFPAAIAASGVGVIAAFGFWLQISSPPDGISADVFRLLDADNAHVGGMAVAGVTHGTLEDGLLFTSTTVQFTHVTPINVCDGEWHYVEFRNTLVRPGVYIDNVDVGILGVVSFTDFTTFEWASIPGRIVTVDDLIIYTDATGAPTATTAFPLGPQLTTTMRPASDVQSEFLRSHGAINCDLVNEVSPNTDDWVQSDDVGFQDLYQYDGALVDSPAPDTIHAAMITALIRNPDVGTVNNALICMSGTVQSDGTSAASPLRPRYRQTSFTTDPETAAEWEAARLNSALFGVKVAA